MKRLYYLDSIRVFLIILVFYHHGAIGFGASGGWYYYVQEPTSGITQALLSLTMGIDQSYFMSLFFFISALLMPSSFDHKGARRFIRERLLRLGIPLLVYTFVIHPILIKWLYGTWGRPGLGPTWFIFTLLVFELSYAAYRIFMKRRLSIRCVKPKLWHILAFWGITGGAAFLLRLVFPVGSDIWGLQFGFFSLYIGMYALGIVAARNNWLEHITLRDSRPWFFLAIAGIPMVMAAFVYYKDSTHLFSGGWNLKAAFYAFWEPMMCIGICYFLLAFGKKYLNRSDKWLSRLSADSYAVYLIHPIFVVGATLLAEELPLTPFARFQVALLIGIPLCFLAADVIHHSLGAKRTVLKES